MYKKVSGRTFLSPLEMELGESKDCMYQILYCMEVGMYIHFQARHCQNYQLYQTTASNKSCWALNFIQESQWAHMFISPRGGAGMLQGLICFKYYTVLKLECRLLLGSMLQNIPITLKNDKNCLELHFLQKTRWTHMSISPFFEIFRFKKIWKTFCTDFVNYFMEIFRIN